MERLPVASAFLLLFSTSLSYAGQSHKDMRIPANQLALFTLVSGRVLPCLPEATNAGHDLAFRLPSVPQTQPSILADRAKYFEHVVKTGDMPRDEVLLGVFEEELARHLAERLYASRMKALDADLEPAAADKAKPPARTRTPEIHWDTFKRLAERARRKGLSAENIFDGTEHKIRILEASGITHLKRRDESVPLAGEPPDRVGLVFRAYYRTLQSRAK